MVLFCHIEWVRIASCSWTSVPHPNTASLCTEADTQNSNTEIDKSTGTKYKGDQNLFSRMNRNIGNRNTQRSLSMKAWAVSVQSGCLPRGPNSSTPVDLTAYTQRCGWAETCPEVSYISASLWEFIGRMASTRLLLGAGWFAFISPNPGELFLFIFFSGEEQKSIYFIGNCQGHGCVCVFSLAGTTF